MLHSVAQIHQNSSFLSAKAKRLSLFLFFFWGWVGPGICYIVIQFSDPGFLFFNLQEENKFAGDY